MKNYIFALFLFTCGTLIHSQSASEVLKYVQARPYGTARALGAGEALGALGADFTAIGINPAGIGLFRKSDFYFSLYANLDEQESSLRGNSNPFYSKTKDSYGISGVGIVFTANPVASKWTNASFAINVNKTADFSKSYYFKGRSTGSITDRFLELALDPNQNGLHGLDPNQLDDFEAGLAYETGAIFNPDPASDIYSTDLLDKRNYLLPKEQILKTTGGLYNLSFGIGGNYEEKFAVGASLDIPLGTFSSTNQYQEYEAVRNEVLPFKNLQFDQNLSTEISGIGAKLGIIYKFNQNFRLGLALQTPTYLWMKDTYTTALSYAFNNQTQDTSFTAYSPDGSFSYRLILPMRGVLSAAYISSKGFLSADLDYFNVRKTHYNLTSDSDDASDYDYQQIVNDDIKKQFKPVIQFRLGGELALNYLRLRAGIQFLQQAYANSDAYDTGYSFGVGYRADRYYIDLGYKIFSAEQAYAPYTTGNSDFDGNGTGDAPTPLVDQKSTQQLIQLTLGFKI